MPSFSDSFWSADYATGLNVLYGKLQQGVTENQQLLTIATLRADAEDAYSERLSAIPPAADKLAGTGFARDDGASARKAYEGVRSEMLEASKNHAKIAVTIRDLVVSPFSRWCREHRARIVATKEDIDNKLKEYNRQGETVKKLRAYYFNKCRVLEDLEEEQKLAFQPADTPGPRPPTLVLPEIQEEDDVDSAEFADVYYPPDRLKEVLTHMVTNMPLREFKVAILGTYQNTATGADFVEYFQKHMDATSISFAERIGQDMTDGGYLRLVGQVGSTFANSSRLNYQIRPKVFEITKIPLPKKPLIRTGTFAGMGSRPHSRTNSLSTSNDDSQADSPVSAVTELFSGWNPLNNAHPNETPLERLKREAGEADERYKLAVAKLDRMRCALEEDIVEYLKFMERCELDRLKAIKTVILDFSGAISNVLPSMTSTVDQMLLFQESIQPIGDLRYLLENYRTGAFIPRVTPYENYYGNVEDQTFGVDLEARARADRKRVPILVTNILTFLDEHYPALEGDEARRMIWLADVPLKAIHSLRSAINNGQAAPSEALEKYEVPVVAAALKLYLLELPDSIISCQLYEIVRSAYNSAEYASEEARVKILQGTLSNLRLNNIATLDVILTHFVRLIDLTSADDSYITALTQVLAPCIIRPRQENTLSMGEKWSARLLKDLFQHKDEIFGELKRQSHSNSFGSRPRAPSTDERNRRAAQEARAKAIASRSRGVSPAASMRHRRDRSRGSDGSTRFPINVGSPTAVGKNGSNTVRNSLEVPAPSLAVASNAADGSEVAGGVNGDPSAITASNVAAALNRKKGTSRSPASFNDHVDVGATSITADTVNAGPDPDERDESSSPKSKSSKHISDGSQSTVLSSDTPASASSLPATTEIPLDDTTSEKRAAHTAGNAAVVEEGVIGAGSGSTPESGRNSPAALEKTNSLSRSSHVNRVSSLRNKFQKAESTEASAAAQEAAPAPEPRGVTLTDAPMDDSFV
ncbi:hypothetical protein KEM52_000453 [Ascosphaera acerosa]|nr:hypothetical protein KEM52_000453 [Ascosphaera acerosa]